MRVARRRLRPPGAAADRLLADDVRPFRVPSRRTLVGLWLGVAVALGALLAVGQAGYEGLDDPDQAQQRPGFLDARSLPTSVPTVVRGLPAAGRRTVVFFVRAPQLGPLGEALDGERHRGIAADVAIVTAGSLPSARPTTPTVSDPSGRLARAYGMRAPRDGGPPVGYAIVDSSGRVRYATLDPAVAQSQDEARTVLDAVP